MALRDEIEMDSEGLVLRYLADPKPDLKDLVILAHGALVERVARRFAGLEPVEDLTQVGYIGLLNALARFDPQNGVRFATYATHLVAGEIKHYLRDRGQTIRQPAWLQELRHRATRVAAELQAQLSRAPTDAELADALGIAESAIVELRNASETMRVASLDGANGSDESGETDADQLDDPEAREGLSVEDKLVLREAIHRLRDLEREVLVMFHFETKSQAEIAAHLGISCNYVSHILRQSLTKLRRILETDAQRERLLRREQELVDDSVFDPDTQTYSEAYFFRRLQEELHRAAATKRHCGLIRVEFAGLATLGKFFGPPALSEFLAEAGELLRGSVRRLDIVCRFGETGFAVILPGSGPSASVVRSRLAERSAIWLGERPAPIAGVRMLLGDSSFPDAAQGSKELIELSLPQELDEATLAA